MRRYVTTRLLFIPTLLQPSLSSVTSAVRMLASKSGEVDEFNREMAEVFGVPFAPEATCLSPSAAASLEGMLPELAGPEVGSQTWSQSLSTADTPKLPQLQQLPASATSVINKLLQTNMQMQGQVRMLQKLIQQQGNAAASATTVSAAWDSQPVQQQAAWSSAGSTAGPAWDSAAASQRVQPQEQQQQQLSHVNAQGQASMVDVSAKSNQRRIAAASCRVLLGEAAFQAVAANALAKGDVLRIAQIAGIQGAKATSQLIPLCHNIFISSVDVQLSLDEASHAVDIIATARATGQTGVEMEALTGAAVAALTVYDMTKAVSKGIRITELQLEYKEGGKSGTWNRGQGPDA